MMDGVNFAQQELILMKLAVHKIEPKIIHYKGDKYLQSNDPQREIFGVEQIKNKVNASSRKGK
jgi:hypothetical protein